MNVPVILKSKTFWGSVVATVGWILSQPKVGAVEIVQGLGAVVTAAGVRDAIDKGPSGP